jgi:hypothetical protein
MFRRPVASLRRFKNFLSHYDWAAIVGCGLVLAFALLVLVAPYRWFVEHAQQPHHEHTAAAADQQSKQQCEISESIWERTTCDPVALYTLWLSVFTFVMATSTIGLWWATRRTLVHAQESSERQLRAYVFIGPSQIRPVAPGAWPVAVINFKNTGQTPAYKMEAIISDLIFDEFKVGANRLTPIDRTQQRTNESIGPGQERFIQTDEMKLQITQDMFNKLVAGTHAIFVHGEIRYRDSFCHDRRTLFRLFTGGPIKLSRGTFLAGHHDGNDAD